MGAIGSVSCIIPYHNGAGTIARAIDSALRERQCLEAIVVDDGASVPMEPALTSFHHEQTRAGRLRVIRLAQNQGQAAARNMGAAVAQGSYLAMLDQDDLCLPGCYDHAAAFLDANPAFGALEFGAEFVRDGRTVLDAPDPRYPRALHSAPWNVVVRRNVFWACGGFPIGDLFRGPLAGEDLVFKSALKQWFAVATATDKLVRHEVRAGGATERFLNRTEASEDAMRFLDAEADESSGAWQREALAHLARVQSHIENASGVQGAAAALHAFAQNAGAPR